MQYVNDDMDELFRRAAEEYPLKTDSADWDKVMNKLQTGGNESSIPEKEKSRRRYFFLLLLIPLLVICTTYIRKEFSPGDRLTVQDKKTNEAITNGSASNPNLSTNATNSKNTVNKNAASTESLDESANNVTAPNENTTDGSSVKDKPVVKADKPGGLVTKSKQVLFSERILDKKKVLPITKKTGKQKEQSKTLNQIKNNLVVNDNNRPADKQTDNDTKSIVSTIQPGNNPTDGQTDNVVPKTQTAPPDPIITTQAKPSNEDSAQQKKPTQTSKDKKQKRKEPKLYFGLLAGPDYTAVKSTDVRGTGYSVGLLAGYNFNKKLAVETGLLWDRKKYQSEGKYFDTKRLNWQYVTVVDIWGYCDMYEIPLNLRYNFSANTKRTWFANAGISSYLMKRESYDYNYLYYNVPHFGSKEYKNTTNNWLSVAHLSVGLQKKLGKIGDLRIEPYVKLPLNGVGIGSMPLRSGGIYFGLTRPIR